MQRVSFSASEKDLDDAPAEGDLEVSIFGPGKGESVLMHVGNNEWIIVDSCRNNQDKSIPALNYLERIGVDAGANVKLVVATHAHDDHLAGISEIISRCASAEFVASSAIESTEFFNLMELDAEQETNLPVRQTVLREYRGVMDVLGVRQNASGVMPFIRAVENLVIWPSRRNPSVGDVKILALSPSHQAVTRSLRGLGSLIPTQGEGQKLLSIDPNELAVALWVTVGKRSILLGADLLVGPAGCGWTAVLDFFEPSSLADVYKVPHHGAPNAHHDDIWKNLVSPEAICLIAPYRAGSHRRPDLDDRKRLAALSPNVFITADPETRVMTRGASKVAQSLGPLAGNVREPWGIPGHVRARVGAAGNEWSVRTVKPAHAIKT